MAKLLFFLFKGISIGFSIAAPIGPVGVLSLRKVLHKGKTAGLASGLGASFASLLYATTLLFGFSLLSDFIVEKELYLRWMGALLLFLLGTKVLFSKQLEAEKKPAPSSLVQDFASSFFLNITNPIALFAYLSVFSSHGFEEKTLASMPLGLVVTGVLIGSTIWWAVLTNNIAKFKSFLSDRILYWIHKAVGVTLLLFGILSIPFK